MALPFLPAQHIQSTFVGIESLVPQNGKMCELINYVFQSRIEHTVFVTHCWTMYHTTVRFSHNKAVRFGTVPFTLPLVPDYSYRKCADFSVNLSRNPS